MSMVRTFSPFGYEGAVVTVEVDLRAGIPPVDIVGLSDGCVTETCARVKAAFRNQGLDFPDPDQRVLASFSPADLKKEGAGFYLPLALGILEAMALDTDGTENKVMVMGELEPSGKIRPVKAVTAAMQTAPCEGILYAILPKGNEIEAFPGIRVAWVSDLKEAFEALKDLADGRLDKFKSCGQEPVKFADIEFEPLEEGESSLDNVENLDGMKWAMTVAVAGKLNMIAVGAPGCGKTMMLQKLPQITPKLQEAERSAVRRIYSIAGLSGHPKNGTRPFRVPHHTASIEGICGGGVSCRPGEISLAHNGILFLDEAAEFRSSVLQMLRVPLENHNITLSRAGRTTVYPANFQLFLATNPCPCGNLGSSSRICLCSAKSVENYWKKFSGPLLDRIDIRYFFDMPVEHAPLSLEQMRTLVTRAQKRQYERQGCLNKDMTIKQINSFITYTEEAKNYLAKEADKHSFSPRAVTSVGIIARTIADMDESYGQDILTEHVHKALELRKSLDYIEHTFAY